VILFGGVGAGSAWLVSETSAEEYQARSTYESLPFSVFGGRGQKEHFVRLLTDEPAPVPLPVGAEIRVDPGDEWSPFFEVTVVATSAEAAELLRDQLEQWLISESLTANQTRDRVELQTWSAELELVEDEFEAADQASVGSPADADLRRHRDTLRNRISELERRIADADVRLSAGMASIATTERHGAREKGDPNEHALVGALVGVLLGTAVVVVVEP